MSVVFLVPVMVALLAEGNLSSALQSGILTVFAAQKCRARNVGRHSFCVYYILLEFSRELKLVCLPLWEDLAPQPSCFIHM